MALETGTLLPDLNTANPADTDAEAQGAAHIRLLKTVLKNQFPNWTDTSGTGGTGTLTSTQAQLDAVAQAYAAGSLSVADLAMGAGTVADPSLTFGTDDTSGLWASAAGVVDLSISGVLVALFNSTGLGITGAFSCSANAAVGGTLTVTGNTTLNGSGITISSGAATALVPQLAMNGTAGILIGSGVAVVPAGYAGCFYMPCAGTITAWKAHADQSGTFSVNVAKNGTAIGFTPALSTAQDASASGLSVSFAAGDLITFTVPSAATACTLVNVTLLFTRTGQ